MSTGSLTIGPYTLDDEDDDDETALEKMKRLPPIIQSLKWISAGATSSVYKLSSRIALKYRIGNQRRFEKEQRTLKLLQRTFGTSKTGIVSFYYATDDMTFLEMLDGITLEMWMRARQTRTSGNYFGRVCEVSHVESTATIVRWMYDLTKAVSALEAVQVVHGDLVPHNIIILQDNTIRLIDFDRVQRVGDEYVGGAAPFSKRLGCNDPQEYGASGSAGLAGPRVEQLALGSLFYCMSRGFEPYEDVYGENDGPRVNAHFRNNEFPTLSASPIDQIINRCWRNQYPSIAHLHDAVARELEIGQSPCEQTNDVQDMEDECRAFAAQVFKSITDGIKSTS